MSKKNISSISPWKFADPDELPRADGDDVLLTQVDVELDLDPDFHRPYLLEEPFISSNRTPESIRLDDMGLLKVEEALIPELSFSDELLWLDSKTAAVSETGESRCSLVASEPSLDSIQDTTDCAESTTTSSSPTTSETNIYSSNLWPDDKIHLCPQCSMAFTRRCDLK